MDSCIASATVKISHKVLPAPSLHHLRSWSAWEIERAVVAEAGLADAAWFPAYPPMVLPFLPFGVGYVQSIIRPSGLLGVCACGVQPRHGGRSVPCRGAQEVPRVDSGAG